MNFKFWKREAKKFVRKTPVLRSNGFVSAQTNDRQWSWEKSSAPINAYLRNELTALRARSRDRARNSEIGKRYPSLLKSNVVGSTGVILQSKASDAPGKIDKLASYAIESAWAEWSKPKNCDASGRSSLTTLMQLVISSIAIDGEVLFRFIYGSKAGPYGFSIQLIDPEYLDVNFNDDRNGTRIRMGVELNEYNKHVAYYIIQKDGDYNYNGKRYVRIPASEMKLLFRQEYVDQIRGIPWMSTGLHTMKQQDGFQEAALINARVGASKSGVLEQDVNAGEYTGDGKLESGEIVEYLDPGQLQLLPPGVKLRAFDPAYPNGEFSEFNKNVLRRISVGLDVSYASLSNDLSDVNYTSLREGNRIERDVYKYLQNWFIDEAYQEVFDRWIEYSLLNRKILVKDRPLRPELLSKYKEIAWQPKRWDHIDPLKDSKANESALLNLTTSRSQLIREAGQDPDDVFEDIAQENEKLKALGLEIVPKSKPQEVEKEAVNDEDDLQIDNGRR